MSTISLFSTLYQRWVAHAWMLRSVFHFCVIDKLSLLIWLWWLWLSSCDDCRIITTIWHPQQKQLNGIVSVINPVKEMLYYLFSSKTSWFSCFIFVPVKIAWVERGSVSKSGLVPLFQENSLMTKEALLRWPNLKYQSLKFRSTISDNVHVWGILGLILALFYEQ